MKEIQNVGGKKNAFFPRSSFDVCFVHVFLYTVLFYNTSVVKYFGKLYITGLYHFAPVISWWLLYSLFKEIRQFW